MLLLRRCLALFAASSSSSSSSHPKIERRLQLSSSKSPSSSFSDVDVTEAPPFEPIRDTCLEGFQRAQEENQDEGGSTASTMLSSTTSLSSFSTIRNGPQAAGSAESMPPKPQVAYRVCLSPGCVADGALRTFERLLALAPPHLAIQPGSCHSLCGNGPVVDVAAAAPPSPTTSNNNNNHKRMRKVSGSKVLQILEEEGAIPELVTGYELVLKGDEAFAAHNYQACIEMYRQAVEIAFRPALDSQAAREHLSKLATPSSHNKGGSAAAPAASSSTSRRGSASGPSLGAGATAQLSSSPLDWLVRARRNTATSLLQLGDVGSALLEAQAACNLSRNTCWKSFAVVSECYKVKGNAQSEYETLKALFALNVDEDSLDFPSKNSRRELQFRMQRLAKDLKS